VSQGKTTSANAPHQVVTKFVYDPLGQLLQTINPEGHPTSYNYDLVGRLLERDHPDAGTTSYTYDKAGNLTSTLTANLAGNSTPIEYDYDYNRLVHISYPDNPENNVWYAYAPPDGGPGSGRVVKQQDASGVQQFFYGSMGEITKNIHTFVMPLGSTYTLQMEFEYDSWNRIKQMTYPDGEVVTYGYDAGGQLVSMQGLKGQDSYSYIDNIEYNRYGSRTAIEYGNGTSAEYTYDPLMQRLTNLKSFDRQQNHLQNLDYYYDAASNIIAIGNSASALPNQLGGNYFNIFSYDSLYRLTYSQSWFYDYQSTPYSRTTQMQYSAAGNIMSKSVNASLLLDGAVVNKNYTHQYTYNQQQQPHTLASAGNSTFSWDLNGNMTRHDGRVLCWDEENRLGSARDPEHLAAYLYNAGGERVWKFTGEVSQMGQSGETVIEHVSLRNKTLYASSFFVANDQGYTKHYFAGSERICSKLGGGLLLAPVSPTETTVEELYEDYEQMRHRLHDLLYKFANCNPEPEQQTVTYIDIDHFLGGIEEQLTHHGPEPNRFFFHPDHLGSSSFITDAAGEGYQHLQYLPFGETAVSQKLSWWSTPYQFTGKEKDDETGYNYFGARYYSSDISIWLSVDPMSDRGPEYSPYVYVFQKPLVAIDPDGQWPRPPETINDAGPLRRFMWNLRLSIKKRFAGPDAHISVKTTNGITPVYNRVRKSNQPCHQGIGRYENIANYNKGGSKDVNQSSKEPPESNSSITLFNATFSGVFPEISVTNDPNGNVIAFRILEFFLN
jgi:RHS repeat-associated protein